MITICNYNKLANKITTNNQKGENTSVILLNYFTDSKYRKRSFTANLRKYTIGLPAVAVGGLKSLISSGKNEEMLHGNNDTTVVGENRIAFLLLNSDRKSTRLNSSH